MSWGNSMQSVFERKLVRIAALGLLTGMVFSGCGDASSKGKSNSEQTPGEQGGSTGGASSAGQNNAVKTSDFATSVSGLPEVGSPVRAERVELKFAVVNRDGQPVSAADISYQCRLNDSEKTIPCSGAPFVISGLKDGTYKVTVTATFTVDGVKVQTADVTTVFAVELPPNTRPANQALGNVIQVGDSYQLTVPAGLHITEYSSSKTTGVLSYYRIMVESDPYYLGNHSCTESWDRGLVSISPAGQPLMYCHSTPTREAYKTRNEFRLAHNHIEIATDTALVNSENGERLSLAAYDTDFDSCRPAVAL